MKEKQIKSTTEFEEYVRENWEEQKDTVHNIIKLLIKDDDLFESGFLSGMHWIGDLLGLDLSPASEEERREVDRVFEEVAKGRRNESN